MQEAIKLHHTDKARDDCRPSGGGEVSSPNPSPVVIGPTWQRGPDGKFILPERTLGWDVLAWTAEYLRQPDGPDAGKPWRYTPEQARFILWWYALDEYGRFVYRYGMLRRVKGWGLPGQRPGRRDDLRGRVRGAVSVRRLGRRWEAGVHAAPGVVGAHGGGE